MKDGKFVYITGLSETTIRMAVADSGLDTDRRE